MKVKLFFIFLLITTLSIAQKSSDNKEGQCPLSVGQNQLNAGVGLSSWGVPIYVGIDHCFKEDLTFGAEVSFRRYRHKWFDESYYEQLIGIYANCNYHFNTILEIPSNWDLYLGLNLGFNMWLDKNDDFNDSHSSGIGLGGQIGGRYYFSDKFGLNLEVGSGNAFSGGKFGISIRL